MDNISGNSGVTGTLEIGARRGQTHARSLRLTLTALLGAALLAGCGNREEILPGERLDLRDGLMSAPADEGTDVNRSVPARLSAQVASGSWTHRGGSVTHYVQHPALGAGTTQVFAASIGQGNDRKHRITADPVVADGRVFTLDSRARVQASSASTGGMLWQADLTPARDRADDASGGGLAVVGNRLYVTTGFGDVVALDATTGAQVWLQDLGASATGAPSVANDVVYVVSKDSRAWALETANGRIRWQFAATPSPSSVVGGAGPAIASDLALFPFSSGELVATFRNGGVERWRARVVGTRLGRAYARVSDITAGPVVIGDSVFTGTPAGRTERLSLGNGEVMWSAEEGAVGPLWVDGGSVYLVSDAGALVRLDAADGSKIWEVQLETFESDRPRRFKDVVAHYGPVLAGGKLWVASDNGLMRAFNPDNGALVSNVTLPSGAATNPVVANRTLYVVGQNGQLQAFR